MGHHIYELAFYMTPPAIQTAASRIAAKHPHLADMAAQAATYAARDNGVVHLSETLVHVRNVAGTTYRLTYTSNEGWQCTCPAFSYRPAVINTHRYCKHIMAMAIQNRAKGEPPMNGYDDDETLAYGPQDDDERRQQAADDEALADYCETLYWFLAGTK